MEAVAFCPAHITGFFKAELNESQECNNLGSMGAGFSIKDGVTTRIKVSKRNNQKENCKIQTLGYESEKKDISEFIVNEFLKLGNFGGLFLEITHEITIPVGYGLGSSSAVALSLSFALNKVLDTKLSKEEIGQIAHRAEVNCKTGLGDVLASYYGGFEVRTKPGAPGIGKVESINAKDVSIIMICFSPISTNKFLKERLSQINGLGGKMVTRLLKSRDYNHFQNMSLEFARYVDVMTPRMEKVIEKLTENGISCGVALFGETIFSMIPQEKEQKVMDILKQYPEGIIIKSKLDKTGARVLQN